MSSHLDFAKKLALQAGDIMLEHFHENVDWHEKDDKTIVTIADEKVNSLVISELSSEYPDHSILGEEESKETDSEYIWVCDPIDGTVPYAKGLPTAAFSLALVHNGSPIVGVIYDPFMKRLYSAEKGKGAYLNDNKMKVNDNPLDRRATINIEWWPEADYDLDTALHNLSMKQHPYVLHLGSVVYASTLVASGRYEACIYAGTDGKVVDIAAVKIIVEEAGGKVTDLTGNEQTYDGKDINGAIISNGVVHDEIVQAVKEYV